MTTRHDGRRALSKGRMESFSDGVFGFAITLLSVDLVVHPPGTALHQLLHAWPSLVAYLISFLTIGTAWLGHASLTDRLARTDRIFLRLNLLLELSCRAQASRPGTRFAAALHDPASQRVYVTLYGLTILAIRLLGAALDAYARREHLYSPHEDGEDPQRKLLPVVLGYVIAILIGLALPELAVALYFAVAAYAIVPFRDAARLLFRRT